MERAAPAAALASTWGTSTWATSSAPSSEGLRGLRRILLRPAQRPPEGESLRANPTITFEEAAFGCEKEINLNRSEECEACHGSGCEPGTTAETCPDCRGTGVVRVQQRTGGFAFSSTAACARCRGTGKIIHSPCKACSGSGSVKRASGSPSASPPVSTTGRPSPCGARATRAKRRPRRRPDRGGAGEAQQSVPPGRDHRPV